jgi:hypothetical protein
MAKDPGTTRVPRGTKPVVAAFFSALNEVPEVQRAPVAKAAIASIRNEISASRDTRARGKTPAQTGRKTARVKQAAAQKKATKAAPKKRGAKVAVKRATPAMKKTAAPPLQQKAPRKKAASKRPASEELPGRSETDSVPPEE